MEQNVIINTQLPVTQDFKLLKDEALAFIQQYGGNDWTNLNPSDPGVTILDQLCYALTELGYCNDFTIKDILTGPNGKLQIKNQFYLPENILTTSPVTFTDYRKYLVDCITSIKNTTLYAENSTFCQVFFTIKENIDIPVDAIATEAFYALNKCRNLNELFLMPKVLKAVPQVLTGTIEIANENELGDILIAIDKSISDYIFPSVKQIGYENLVQEGMATNEIFNGPLLQHGFITTQALGTQQTQIPITKISHIIAAVKGVTKVSSLGFRNIEAQIALQKAEIIEVDLSQLEIICKGKSLNYNLKSILSKTKSEAMNVVLGASVNIQTELPTGKYRDINSYYSIQNTFPEIFAVGASAITSNATHFQIAQSRQLKGYLTLFDQVLANQFSQLANIDKLFSFENSMNGNPSDVKEFYAVKDDYEKKHIPYPVPYLTFSPSYYYQSLYHVPHIRPLLKDNELLNLIATDETKKELAHDSWTAYKQNPYNPYMRGLMDFMRDETVDLTRRNNILDHLLARHGESPLIIDAIIEGTAYNGNVLSNQVIVKSLYLQNLGLLSYYRHKAYNYLGANKLENLDPTISVVFDQAFLENDHTDFVFNAEKVAHLEKLTNTDFVNYAAVELKLGLLFGLKMQYKNYLIHAYDKQIASNQDINIMSWLIKQRKGLIFIETNLLWQNVRFHVIIKMGSLYRKLNYDLSYRQLVEIHQFLNQDRQIIEVELSGQEFLKFGESSYAFEMVEPVDVAATFLPNNCIYQLKIEDGETFLPDQYELIFENKLVLIFPLFLKSNAFCNRLELFLQQTMPVAVSYEYHFKDSNYLKSFINTFANWHNHLIYQKDNISELVTQSSKLLANALVKLNATLR